jgi:hypothetical protein
VPDVDFDTPATVSWSEGPLSGEMSDGTGGLSRRFDRLADALAFAADLSEAARPKTWISTESQTFGPDEWPTLSAETAAQPGA